MAAVDNPALQGNPVASFLKYAIPSALGILTISTASVIDGIFIGRYEGSTALAAINLIIPVISIYFGLVFMLAVGSSVMAGKYVGEGRYRDASNIYSKSLIVTLAYGILLLVGGLLGSQHLFRLLGASPELFSLMAEYFGALIWFVPVHVTTGMLYFFVRIAGYPGLASAGLIAGALSNLALDWWLIGVQGEGLRGAALATGLSNVITLGVLLLYRLKPDCWLQFIPRQRHWGELIRTSFNGLSEFINEISAGVVTFILNLVIIQRLGVDGVAAFSVVSYSLYIGLLFSFSVADSLQVVCSQCYGARDRRRLKQFVQIAVGLVLACATGFILLLCTQGERLITLFVTDSATELMPIAFGFIQVLWPVFALNGLNVVISAYLTATQHALASSTIAMLRSLILPLGLLLLITQLLPQYPFLLAITGAEALTLIGACWLYLRYRPGHLIPARNTGCLKTSAAGRLKYHCRRCDSTTEVILRSISEEISCHCGETMERMQP